MSAFGQASRRVLLLLACCVLLGPGSLRAESLVELFENSKSRKPYIQFAARGGVPGHAFVIFGVELDNGLMFEKGVFGFYPADGGKLTPVKLLFSTDSEITFKWKDLERDLLFRVAVDDDKQKAAEAVLVKWQDAKYSLFGNNCSTLAGEIASAIGMRLPGQSPGSTLPIDYMQALKDIN